MKPSRRGRHAQPPLGEEGQTPAIQRPPRLGRDRLRRVSDDARRTVVFRSAVLLGDVAEDAAGGRLLLSARGIPPTVADLGDDVRAEAGQPMLPTLPQEEAQVEK